MPGPQVKNWDQYHALREQGKSKESAAKIVNAQWSKAAKEKPLAQAAARRLQK